MVTVRQSRMDSPNNLLMNASLVKYIINIEKRIPDLIDSSRLFCSSEFNAETL